MPNNTAPRIVGVLLAAGRGRRMKGAKQFEPWPTEQGPQPLVAASFDAVQKVCDAMIAVLGHRADEVAKLLTERLFQSVLSDPDAPMYESIRAGLLAAHALNPRANVLLHPGDHPEVAITTLNGILEAARKNRNLAVLPEYRGQGGHPVLIPPSVIKSILATECPQGLRSFWDDHPELVLRLNTDDPSCIRDVDYCLPRERSEWHCRGCKSFYVHSLRSSLLSSFLGFCISL